MPKAFDTHRNSLPHLSCYYASFYSMLTDRRQEKQAERQTDRTGTQEPKTTKCGPSVGHGDSESDTAIRSAPPPPAPSRPLQPDLRGSRVFGKQAHQCQSLLLLWLPIAFPCLGEVEVVGEVTMNLSQQRQAGWVHVSSVITLAIKSGHMRNGHGNRMEGEKKITGSF